MTDPRQETLTDKIATLIQEGHINRRTSAEVAESIVALIAATQD